MLHKKAKIIIIKIMSFGGKNLRDMFIFSSLKVYYIKG
jgi:hypothetical protein